MLKRGAEEAVTGLGKTPGGCDNLDVTTKLTFCCCHNLVTPQFPLSTFNNTTLVTSDKNFIYKVKTYVITVYDIYISNIYRKTLTLLSHTGKINEKENYKKTRKKPHKLMLEKHIEARTCKSLKQAGALPLKLTSPSMNGLPDRLILLPGGKAFFIEFKRPGAKPRPLQVKVHRLLEKLGFKVLVIDQPTQGEEILNAL